MLAKLPRSTKDELNKITTGLNWRQFDPEVFAEFMHAILDALSSAPASRFAAGAFTVLFEQNNQFASIERCRYVGFTSDSGRMAATQRTDASGQERT
jgi:hypothetical protein